MTSISMLLSVFLAGADPMPQPDKKELELLAGEWLVQEIEARGQRYDCKETTPKMILEIKGDKWIFTGQEKGEITALDPKTNPKCMDLRSVEEGRKGQVDEAIYKIEGDVLTICLYQGKGKQRPTRFEASPDLADTILVVCQRVKKE